MSLIKKLLYWKNLEFLIPFCDYWDFSDRPFSRFLSIIRDTWLRTHHFKENKSKILRQSILVLWRQFSHHYCHTFLDYYSYSSSAAWYRSFCFGNEVFEKYLLHFAQNFSHTLLNLHSRNKPWLTNFRKDFIYKKSTGPSLI